MHDVHKRFPVSSRILALPVRPAARHDQEGEGVGDFRRRAARWLAGVFAIAAFAMAAGLMLGAPYARAAEQALTGAVTSLAAATTGGADNASAADGSSQGDVPADTTGGTDGGDAAGAVDADQSTAVAIRGSVSVVNGNGEDRLGVFGGRLGFTLKATNGGPMPSGAKDGTLVVANGENGAEGIVDFGTIDYSGVSLDGVTADSATGLRSKTFTYEVTQEGELGSLRDGRWDPEYYDESYSYNANKAMGFDNSRQAIRVTVSETFAGGGLVASPESDAANGLFSFSDTYSAEMGRNASSVVPKSQVTVIGKDFSFELKDGEATSTKKYSPYDAGTSPYAGKATFTITALDGAPVPAGVTGDSWVVRNDANFAERTGSLGLLNFSSSGFEADTWIALQGMVVTEKDFEGATYVSRYEEYTKYFSYRGAESASGATRWTSRRRFERLRDAPGCWALPGERGSTCL